MQLLRERLHECHCFGLVMPMTAKKRLEDLQKAAASRTTTTYLSVVDTGLGFPTKDASEDAEESDRSRRTET